MRSMQRVVGVAFLLGVSGALAAACSGSSPTDVACDPTTDPTCTGTDGGTDGTLFGDSGIVVLPDGAWLLPDGAVVPPGSVDTGPTSGETTPPSDAPTTGEGGLPKPGCTADNAACTSSAECCGGNCASGKCTPLSATCKTLGNPCAGNGECCSSYCVGGFCGSPSFCTLTGDTCSATGLPCCSGTCNVAAGATLGTCGAVPTGPSRCSGGVDGTLCGSCTDCCSRICAPYGPTGVSICQRAEGCHVNGDLCRKDTDCCGYAGSGLPGDGHVTCDFSGAPAGSTIGICRNPKACNPEGDVCHYKSTLTCGTDSAPADCCGALGAKGGACIPDALGVPRCYAGGPCKKTGETCAYSADCCDGRPCVPDATGILKCGAVACEPKAGACTTDADCCSGLTCVVPVGSVSGVCGGFTPPPPPPPPTDAGGDSSTTTDSAGVDSGTPLGDGGVLPCSLYGQTCKTNGDCCNGVPCTDTTTSTPCSGGTCTCHNVIR